MKIFLLAFILFINSNADYKASKIKFEGLTQISNKIAKETLGIQNGNTYNDKQINKAIKRFYDFNYFNDIKIYDKNNTLLIEFLEKPFIINLSMNGYKTAEDDLKNIFSIMNIKKGNMFTKEKIKKSKEILLNILKEEGFVHSIVEVDIEKINSQSVGITFNVNKGDEIIIENINYIGAKKLTQDDFEEATSNKEKDLISWWFGQNDGIIQFSQLQYDSHRIKNTYLKHGYLDAKVTPAYSLINYNTNKANIDFIIYEGEKYDVNNILIYINEDIIKSEDIIKKLNLKKNNSFNISHLRKDVNILQTLVSNKGYAYAKISYDIRKDKKNNTAEVIFNVIEGEKVYINDVIIKNNNRTLDRVIRRDIYLSPKDLFNLSDYTDSKNKLQRTGYFSSVNIIKKRISKNKMDLIVDVKEASTGNLTLGGGYGSSDGWSINTSVNDKNIFGSGMNLKLKLDYSKKTTTATLGVTNPSINDSIYSGSFKIYREKSLLSADKNSTIGDETTITNGFQLGIGRSLNRNTITGINYALEKNNISYEKNVSKNNDYTSSSLEPYIRYTNTDSYYLPRSGMQAGTSILYAGLGGGVKYMQSNTYFKYYYGLQKHIDYDAIIRFKTNIKQITDLGDIKNKTLYLGGPSSLRGYETYAFQPSDKENHPYKKRFTNTIELGMPLLPKAKIRWALFFDYANIGENTYNEIEKSAYGALINWSSPVGPIQFIFARAINPDEKDLYKTSNFEFSLGGRF